MPEAKVVISRSEEERVRNVGKAVRQQLMQWTAGIVTGVRFSDGIAREVTMALLEMAAGMLIASSEAAAKERGTRVQLDDRGLARAMRLKARRAASLAVVLRTLLVRAARNAVLVDLRIQNERRARLLDRLLQLQPDAVHVDDDAALVVARALVKGVLVARGLELRLDLGVGRRRDLEDRVRVRRSHESTSRSSTASASFAARMQRTSVSSSSELYADRERSNEILSRVNEALNRAGIHCYYWEAIDQIVNARNEARARVHQLEQELEDLEAKLCARCKRSCSHLCATPQADADIEHDTAERINRIRTYVALESLAGRQTSVREVLELALNRVRKERR